MKYWAVLCAIGLMGCESPQPAQLTEGLPLALEILDPPGSQIGLHYGQTTALRVRYREDTTEESAAQGQVRFAIFEDPGGSTLTSDRVLTRADGVASVTLTAGAAERAFRVRASAHNASDVEFAISVSQLDFVDLDVHLSDPVATGNHTLAALLYEETSCTELESAPSLPPPRRRVQHPHVRDTVFNFYNLLSRDYAIVGLVEDESGRARARGCAELGATLLPVGTRSSLPLPLQPVAPTVLGDFALLSVLPASQESEGVSANWRPLACERGAAARLLDLISPHLTMTLASMLGNLRGQADIEGCRGAESMPGSPSIDARLQALLDTPLGPARALPAIVADVSAFVNAAELDSSLTLRDGGGGLLLADHTLERVTFANASAVKVSYFLNPLGLPILQNRGLGATLQGATLTLEAHDFTLGLPLLWEAAIEKQAIGARFPTLSPPILSNFVAAIFDVASHANKNGCAAIEALVCENVSASNCIGEVAPACDAAVAELAAVLGASFERPVDVDLRLSGHAVVVDFDDNLSADALQDGTWDSISASFVGTQTP